MNQPCSSTHVVQELTRVLYEEAGDGRELLLHSLRLVLLTELANSIRFTITHISNVAQQNAALHDACPQNAYKLVQDVQAMLRRVLELERLGGIV